MLLPKKGYILHCQFQNLFYEITSTKYAYRQVDNSLDNYGTAANVGESCLHSNQQIATTKIIMFLWL